MGATVASGGWDLALDAMTDLDHAFKTREYQEYLRSFAQSMTNKSQFYDLTTESVRGDPLPVERVHQLVDAALTNIQLSDPVWVSADVTDLVQFAADAESFRAQAIREEDLFVEHAFCLFEKPLSMVDVKGLEFRYRALSWSITTPRDDGVRGVLTCKWSHKDDPDDYDLKLPMIGGTPLTLSHVDVIPFGEDRFLTEPILTHAIAQYEALWRLAQQKVVIAGPEMAGRSARRRASNWREIKEVTVLKLRRATSATKYVGEGEGREMKIRTNTRGHWKGQWYPSLQEHRQIWIEEYIRGPADAPLVLKKHAVEFTR